MLLLRGMTFPIALFTLAAAFVIVNKAPSGLLEVVSILLWAILGITLLVRFFRKILGR
ncbi:hypothetical protein [Brucella endophytica]|uniref:hypothetical protein n=1 Tax=Brucella endophytica TaxID=1963359 RepID=UPI0035BC8931